MPLDAQTERCALALDSLGDSVATRRHGNKSFAGLGDRLMVEAVDLERCASGQRSKPRSSLYHHAMSPRSFIQLVLDGMLDVIRHVVMEAAAMLKCHQLGAVADPKDGHISLKRVVQECAIECKLLVGRREVRVRVTGEPSRDEVVTAGQEQTIDALDQRLRVRLDRQMKRRSTGAAHGMRIRDVVVQILPSRSNAATGIVAFRDSDCGFHGCEYRPDVLRSTEISRGTSNRVLGRTTWGNLG